MLEVDGWSFCYLYFVGDCKIFDLKRCEVVIEYILVEEYFKLDCDMVLKEIGQSYFKVCVLLVYFVI